MTRRIGPTPALLVIALLAREPALAAAEAAAPAEPAASAATVESPADPAADLQAAVARVAAARGVVEAAKPDDMAARAAAVAGFERAMTGLQAAVAAAVAREEALAAELEADRDTTARLLASLAAMTRLAPQAQGLHPDGPLAAARAAATMEKVGPALEAEAADLRGRYAALAAARATAVGGEQALEADAAALQAAQAALATAMAAAFPEPVPPPSPTLAALARDSLTVGALAGALADARIGDPPAPAGAAAGPMLWPVSGTLMRRFEERDAAGVRQPGVVVAAPPLAVVRAPADAAVRYAGPFLEYGYVLVLEPEAGTMVVLAGLARLGAQAGTVVRRGDLIGMLGGRLPDVEESVSTGAESGAGRDETLYIEVRRGRGPVDPEPLFAGEDG